MPMRYSGAALRRAARVGVLPVSLLATAAIVAGSSYSVFSSTTSSPNDAFNSGSVALTNDSASSSGVQANTGAALFTVNGLTPGASAVQKCVTVASTSSVATAVKMYALNVSNTNSLAQYLNVTIEIGTASNTNGASCTNFTPTSTIFSQAALSSFESSTGYANGVATSWTPATGSDSRAFRITVQPNSSTMTNTQQSSQAKLDFVWEADSN